MLKQLSERIILIALTLVLLIWGGYHLFQYYHSPIKTETVHEYSVTRTISGRGIAIRDELVIDETAAGTASYLFGNAARVSLGETVAEFHSGLSGTRDAYRMRELENEIEMLRSAQDTNINNYVNADVINRDIRDRLGSLAMMSSTGRCDELQSLRNDITSLVNRRQIAIGKAQSFQERINALTSEYQALDTQTSTLGVHDVKAPVAGYFSRNTDGLEYAINTKMLEKMSISDYLDLIDASGTSRSYANTGKMVISPVWYLAITVEVFQTEWLYLGQTVNIELEGSSVTIPAIVTDLKLENKVDDAVVLLRCDYMTEDVIDIRNVDIKLHSERYTGLRINSGALRFLDDGTRGVYVVDEDNTVRFRRLLPIYEEQSFLLSDMQAKATEEGEYKPVKLYEQVITGGIVYDGMPIQ